MALTQPILNSIAAFDATQEHIFSFISIGGDQVLGSQLTIYDNETGAQVYQGNYTSFKFEYPLAAGTLTNGKYYNATISTINNASEFSEPSNPVAFYCYTAPVLTITNIPASGTIEQSNYTFQGNYVQAEGELLNGYQYTLYDSNKEQISQSAILYDGLYQHTFSGMANDTSYYVELSGSTINNTPVSSGLLLFTIRYIQPASFAICDLVNNCENGFIQISSNIVSIDGKSEPDPPKYIDNKEVDLTGEDISIEQDMKTYWSFVNQQAFNITYDKDTLVNDIKVSTNSGWETVYLPINVTQGRKYTMTFDCDVITQYTPLTSEFKGIRYQVLANVPVNDNLDKEIAGGYIYTLKGKRNYSISFIPTTDIVYFAFNFGFVEDYVQVETKIGNFNLSVGSWVQWDEGFNIQNDFTMRIWGRSFGDNEPIVAMKNELDTDKVPNRIEMKFMATDIIDTLPNYIFAEGDIVTTENAVSESITDLNICGNNYQAQEPTPTSPSKIYFTGDIGNQIDFPDTSVSYTDGLHVAAKPNNNYILLPNRIYTLNFDYVVTNSTTDIYYGIGYGTKDNYVGALTINGEENIQYATQNKGSNSVTFQTPATFEGVDTPYLWIDFAKTIITATVAVDVSNVSLYFGEYTPYQEYGKYNVPFKVLGQNLFNYQKLLYFIDNNTTHKLISNGYSVNPTVQNGDCYALIGYTNNFVPGEKYNLSYQALGNLKTFNLYAVDKGTSDIVNEITLTNDVFVAPDNNYDLMLKFTLDSSSLTNNLNLWNIQIVNGGKALDYTPYTEIGLNMVFDEPLRGIGNVRDYILLDTVNLLNPMTLRAKVKENTTYYFSSSTSNSYLLEFYNIENNLIDTEDISSGTFTTPANCVYVTSEDFTTLNVIPEQIQIEEGNTFSQYFPYITQPSVIRNVGRIIVNGTEDWAKNETVTASNAFYLNNSLVPSYKQNAIGICTHYKTISDISSAEGIFCGVSINIFTAPSYNYTVSTFKTWLAEQNSNGNPVIIYYQLSTPQVYNLSGDYATTLRNFTTQIGTNSILIDSQYPGYLRLKYANSYTDQETKANYVLLKCWNENTIPYVIHSNYITVKSPKDKIFIWIRRKNNIFDLKIENLGEE